MFWFIFICDIIIPLMMMVAGYIMWKHTPKKINHFIGYRTSRSMQNTDTWKFAHEHCGKRWFVIGLVMLLPSIAAHIPFYKSTKDTLGIVCIVAMAIQLVVMVASIFPTENALKNTFNADGTRK